MDLNHTAARVIAIARENAGVPDAAFDYKVSIDGIGGPLGWLGQAAYLVATEHHDGTREQREADWMALWGALQPELQAYARRCRERKYAGWSNEAQSRGQQIRYA